MISAFQFRLLMVLAFIATLSYNAQGQAPAASALTLKVAGLSSEARDAIAHELEATTGTRLVFACVPAGILVFSCPNDGTSHLRSTALDQVRRHASGRVSEELNIGLPEAEQLCAQARNR